MLAEYKTKTNIFIGLGLIVQLLGRFFLMPHNGLIGLLGLFVVLGGAGLFLVGCCFYMKAKGYSELWGLLGLLSLIGLIIMVCFRDKCADGSADAAPPDSPPSASPSALDEIGPKV